MVTAALAQQPRIDRLSPAEGPIGGGTMVTLSGTGFNGATLTLDGAPLVPETQSDDAITLRMPPHANGYAILGVTNASGSAYARFFVIPPRLDQIRPGDITTIAGIGDYGGEYGPAREAELRTAWGVGYGPDGLLY